MPHNGLYLLTVETLNGHSGLVEVLWDWKKNTNTAIQKIKANDNNGEPYDKK